MLLFARNPSGFAVPGMKFIRQSWIRSSRYLTSAVKKPYRHPAETPTSDYDHFSRLPPEVRNRICELVLGAPYDDPSSCLTDIGFPNQASSFDWHGTVQRVGPALLSLLLVSKQIYTETFHIFYATNNLAFSSTDVLYRFLRRIGYARRQHITMVYFIYEGPNAKEAFRLLKTCRRLRRLQFSLPCSMPPGYAALREVRGLEEVIIRPVHKQVLQYPLAGYRCHCQSNGGALSDAAELEKAMKRPRVGRYKMDPCETFNLMKGRREGMQKTEEEKLQEDMKSWLSKTKT